MPFHFRSPTLEVSAAERIFVGWSWSTLIYYYLSRFHGGGSRSQSYHSSPRDLLAIKREATAVLDKKYSRFTAAEKSDKEEIKQEPSVYYYLLRGGWWCVYYILILCNRLFTRFVSGCLFKSTSRAKVAAIYPLRPISTETT